MRTQWMVSFCAALAFATATTAAPASRPNIILVMADDIGYGDVAYNGNPKVKTPALDRLAREGVRLDRFYAGGPVCTPTRATCLTGRNPNRYGTLWAGDFPLPAGEITIAELLRDAGYRTGHFGKWHLGKLTPDRDEGFGEKKYEAKTYMAPWHQGFETCFTIESAAPNFNPAVWGEKWDLQATSPGANKIIMDRPLEYGEGTLVGTPMQPWPFTFWLGERQRAPETIAGEGCELIVNRAVPFIESAVQAGQPFLAVVWFFTPHSPVAAGPAARAPYAALPMREQHWFGAISAMDAQIGRLLETLRSLRVEENTLVWFCSDNGPSWVHELNSAGPLRGKKSELYEGGIRVPAIVRWPAGLAGKRTIAQPLSTLDFLPTLLAVSGVSPKKLPPLDGENVLPILSGETKTRQRPLFFDYPYRDVTNITWIPTKVRQTAVIDGPWKLMSLDDRNTFALYHLEQDIAEKHDLTGAEADRARRMRDALESWTAQCARSFEGADYR
jgi:arylsulfatase A-like enzyme